MPDSLSPRRPRRLTETLLVVALLTGGVFFWANWQSSRARHVPLSEDFGPSFGGRPSNGDPHAGSAPIGDPRHFGGAGMGDPISWKQPTALQRQKAIKTIRAQLKCFDSGDWAGAVALQSQGMRGNFPSPAAFGEMMRHSYSAFVRARRVDFGKAHVNGPMLQIEVALTGRDGQKVAALYNLSEEHGRYTVAGVTGGFSPDGGAPGRGHHFDPDHDHDGRGHRDEGAGGLIV